MSEEIDQEQYTRELEQLIEFSRKVNSYLDLEIIFLEISNYILQNFSIDGTQLYLVDKDQNNLYYYNAVFPAAVSEEIKTLTKNTRIPLNDDGGIHYLVYTRKRYLYLRRLRKSGNAYDDYIVDSWNLQSYFIVPLIIQDEVIGLMDFSNYERKLDLSMPQIESISRFCEQISAAINNASLIKQVKEAKEKADMLILNILPRDIVEELKDHGYTKPKYYSSVSVLFTDFVGFTKIAELLSPQELVGELDKCFSYFDSVTKRYKLEKLKTIGDAYMCAGGIPTENGTHPIDCLLAAFEIQSFMKQMKIIKSQLNLPYWELRLGINTGPLIAGVVGELKFAFDVWGDTVNTASRMESSGENGKINISKDTFDRVKILFECEHRGKISAKNKGEMDMYFAISIKKDFSVNGEGHVPNDRFWATYNEMAFVGDKY